MDAVVEAAGCLSGDLEDVVKKISQSKTLKNFIFRGGSASDRRFEILVVLAKFLVV
jgi:hypothetical protein